MIDNHAAYQLLKHASFTTKKSLLVPLLLMLCCETTTITSTKKKERDTVSSLVKPAQKEVLIFTSTGGGGHMSASNAMAEYLKGDYKVTIIPILKILESFDPIKAITFNYYSAEDFYNYLITHNWIWVTNQYSTIGGWVINLNQYSLAKALEKYLKYNTVDLIISVVPYFNGALLKAVQKNNIPLLIVPTDLDGSTFVNGLDHPDYKKLYYFTSFDDEEIRKKFEYAHLPSERVILSGFPIRKSFFAPKDKKRIKQDFGVPKDKSVVMVLMGAAGSHLCYRYVRRLAKSKLPLHIVACIGRNEAIRKKIAGIKLPSHITLTIVGYTDRISDLMSIANVLITKSGSVSFCEALYMNVPFMLDYTVGVLSVEAFNLEFAKKHNLAEVVTNFRQVPGLIQKYLTDEEFVETKKENVRNIKKEYFPGHLTKVVHQFLAP